MYVSYVNRIKNDIYIILYFFIYYISNHHYLLCLMLTIIITTSPTRVHPSTRILDEVIDSFKNLDGLDDCRKIIVCDGYITKDLESIKNITGKLKSGIVSEDIALGYEDYIINIQNQIINNIYTKTELVKRDAHYGFAENVKYVIDNHVKTPYVMVVQHDHMFIRKINYHVSDLIECMEKKTVNYLGFSMSSDINHFTQSYQDKQFNLFYEDLEMRFECRLKEKSEDYFTNSLKYNMLNTGLPLMNLTFWYDKMHICRTDYYKQIFDIYHFDYCNKKFIKIKSFIEDTFGQIVKSDIKRHGYTAFEKYKCYLLYDDINPAIIHLNSRSKLS